MSILAQSGTSTKAASRNRATLTLKIGAMTLAVTLALQGLPLAAFAQPSDQQASASETHAQGMPTEGESDGIIIELDESVLASADANADEMSLFGLQSDESARLDESDVDEIQGLMAESGTEGIEVGDVVARFDGSVLMEAQPSPGMSDEQAAQAAANVPGVKSAQPNYVYGLVGATDDAADATALSPCSKSISEDDMEALAEAMRSMPNDPFLQRSSSSQPNNQYWAYSADFPQAWDVSGSAGDVTVALMDTAVDINHSDLKANLLTDLAYNASSQDLMANAPLPAMRHGTMTAGLVAAVANNGLGLAGASNNAKVLPIAVFDENGNSTTTQLLSAFVYVFRTMEQRPETNVKVINISAGRYASYNNSNDNLLEAYIDTALARYGIITVCAGGNGWNNGLVDPRTDRIIPGDLPSAVSVTALNPDKTNVRGSDYNMHKDIGAAGMSIYSTVPGGSYSPSSGTSLSAPIVSGAVALMYSAAPKSSPDQIIGALYGTADAIVDNVNDRSQTSGSHGSLDAYMAVVCAKAYESRPFSDVRSGEWFYEPVGFVKFRSIMNGVSGTSLFQPDRGITRAEAACVLYNYAGPQGTSPKTTHVDVDQSEWYAEGVNWACANGVMNGYAESDKFGPQDLLTREQMACIVANYARVQGEPVDMGKFYSFGDRDSVSPWAVDNVAWAVSKGVINGVVNGNTRTISPHNTLSRAEMAGIMSNSIRSGVLD